jgi:DNA-binding transcriptional LysR family regulator
MALIEEMHGSQSGETLLMESPVWVGKSGGAAWQQRPLPISLGAASCVFRPSMIAALSRAGIALRNAIDFPSLETTVSMVESDLAITLLLPSTVPGHLECLGASSGLPALPAVSISMHIAARGSSAACKALADAIRRSYQSKGQGQPILPARR